MLNSHQRCSDSSIFCINAKTCTFRYLDEFFQANQIQRIITGVLSSWHFLFYLLIHRTLVWVVANATGAGGQISARSASLWGTHGNLKWRICGKGVFLLNYGRLMFGTFREGASMCGTLNVCEAFVMTCRQAAAIKPTVWGAAEFGRLAANKRMHGVENAALFNVPHIWSPSRNTPNKLPYPLSLIYRKFPLHILLSKIYIALL